MSQHHLAPPPASRFRPSGFPRSAFALVMAAFCTFGCGTEAPSGPSFTVRDSAGITIAQNRGEVPADGGGWAISAEPSLQIGSMEGDEAYLLYRVWGATRLPDGRIAVVNNRAPDIRIFSAAGEHLHTFGSRGEGPGEFNSPVLAGVLPGDTLVVVDRLLLRINLFHPDDGFIRVATGDPDIEGLFLLEGMFSSGSVVIQRRVYGEDAADGYSRHPTQYRVVAVDGTLEADFGEFPGYEMMVATQETEQGATMLSTGIPFGKDPTVAVGGNRFFYGAKDHYEIQVHNQGGNLNRLIRRDKAPFAITDGHLAAIMEEMIDDTDDNDQARQFRRMFREAPVPEFHPALGAIYADVLGFLWVEEYRLPGENTRATTIFDPEGRMVGSVVLPNRFRVEEIGEDYLLGRSSDELGVEYLTLYDLARPTRE